jgi:hypothetical protein
VVSDVRVAVPRIRNIAVRRRTVSAYALPCCYTIPRRAFTNLMSEDDRWCRRRRRARCLDALAWRPAVSSRLEQLSAPLARRRLYLSRLSARPTRLPAELGAARAVFPPHRLTAIQAASESLPAPRRFPATGDEPVAIVFPTSGERLGAAQEVISKVLALTVGPYELIGACLRFTDA